MMNRARWTVLAAGAFLAVGGCSSGGGDGGGAGTGGNGSGNNGSGNNGGGGAGGDFEPAPYNALPDGDSGWLKVEDVEVQVNSQAGSQGKLMVSPDGTLHYAYFKYHPGSNPGGKCDVSDFSQTPPTPNVNYSLRYARKAPGGSWEIETVPLNEVPNAPGPYVYSLFGLDGLIDARNGDVVLTLSAGGPGLASCGSTDMTIARRNSAGWSFTVIAADSDACCLGPYPPNCSGRECGCPDENCRSGTDVGAWSTIAQAPSGELAATFVDYHNFWDESGQSWQGYEVWHESDGIFGLDPWSGRGIYGDAVFVGDTWVVAYTGFNSSGLWFARRTGNAANGTDWVVTDLQPNARVGERISLATAPNGTLGLAYNRKNPPNDDLIYCESPDGGETWKPCENVGLAPSVRHAGGYPSLVFDSASRPLIAYYTCGSGSNPCTNAADGVHFSFRELNGEWKTKVVHNNQSNKTGLYTQLVLDPATGSPIIAFQDATRGAAMVAYANLSSE